MLADFEQKTGRRSATLPLLCGAVIMSAILSLSGDLAAVGEDDAQFGRRNPFSLEIQGGLKLEGVMSMLAEGGAGFGYSPGVSGILEVDMFRYTGYVLELGYGQSRLPVEDGEIQLDYLKGAFYALIFLADPKSGGFRGVIPYMLAGPYVKKFLSGGYVDSFDGTEYDFAGHYPGYGWGVSAGLGAGFRAAGLTWFVELLGSRSMSETVGAVESNVALLPGNSEMELSACIGVKGVLFDTGAPRGKKLLLDKNDFGRGHGKKIPVAR